MGPVYLVVSARPVNRGQVVKFIIQQGGTIYDPGGIFDGVVTGRDACVNIMWDTQLAEDWFAPIKPVDSSPEAIQDWKNSLALREVLRAKLGTEPGAAIVLDLIRGMRSQWIAWHLIQLMFKEWAPCVLRSYGNPSYPETDLIWTPDELAEFWRKNHRLPHP